MTTEGLPRELTAERSPLALTQILSLCDRILAEYGRRRHLFGWLRAPGAAPGEWLEVAAYYPGNKLVVAWHEQPGPNDHVYSELVPTHGLRLLELGPGSIPEDDPEAGLERLIAALGPAPERARERVTEERPAGRAWSLAPALPAESRPAPRPHADEQHSTRERTMLGAVLGLTLAVAVLVELYVGFGVLGLDHGQIVLAFGLALDACARVLGTIAAERAGNTDAAWGCSIIGSPYVASFAIFGQGGAVDTDPAPLAGMISVIACVVVVIGVVAAVL